MWLTNVLGGPSQKAKAISFEVQSFKVDHWVTEVICDSEAEARAEATRIQNAREGVRVIREFNSPTAGLVETVIFSEMRNTNRQSIQPQPIDEAPVCEQTTDFLGPASRRTITKLLRQYLEKRSLTASELLYNPAEIRRVMNFENLVPGAVGRAAAIQGKMLNQDTRQRRDVIFDALGQLRARAERAAKINLPTAAKHGFTVAMGQVDAAAKGDPAEQDYLAKFVLCNDLTQIQNLLGKIEWLISLAAEGKAEPWQLEVLDALVSDAVATSSVVQDLLGRQPDLGAALIRLLDVVEGNFVSQGLEQAPEVTAALSRWIGSGGAPQSRATLIESVLKGIGGTQALSRGEPEAQRIAYATLLSRVVGPAGFTAGPPMAEAFTTGYLRFIQQGGAEGRRIAIDGVTAMMKSGAERLLYLLSMACTPTGAKEMPTLMERIRLLLLAPNGVGGLIPATVALKPRMQTLATIYSTMVASDIPVEERTAFADRLDGLIADYIVANKIIEKLDDPSAPLRIRALRLMQFAANDILSSPKARRMVRDQIIGHLRQPNFDGKFVEGLNNEDKLNALRSFYDLLRQAQFI
ncbi:MAG: hypothetical protein RLY86_2834 [Pseudomonadota bacterium]|jgi:hypothetical protein